jgi:uncharacterized protein YcbX
MSLSLESIHCYPLKSAAGLSLSEAQVQARGLAHDRRWMVVDADGKFISGRTHPQLVRVVAHVLSDGSLQLHAPGLGALHVPLPAADAARISVTVWDSGVRAALCDAAAAEWLSTLLGSAARLVYMDDAAVRAVDPDHSQPGDEVSFADGFPLLLLSGASIDELNARASHPVDVRRFRPNLVIAGATAHAEDRWKRIRIGEVEFVLPKPCVRCVFTTIDADSGTADVAGEPLSTLKHYRRGPKGISFGMNVIARTSGVVRVGMAVEVLE